VVEDMIQCDMRATLSALRFGVRLLLVLVAAPAIVVSMRNFRRSQGRIGLKRMFTVVAAAAVYLTICLLLWRSLPNGE
jgi:hypothetical protein